MDLYSHIHKLLNRACDHTRHTFSVVNHVQSDQAHKHCTFTSFTFNTFSLSHGICKDLLQATPSELLAVQK